MDNTADLKLLLASRYPLIVAAMREEARFLEILGRAAASLGLPVWVWSATRGLSRLGGEPQYGTMEPLKALEAIAQFTDPAVFVFVDPAAALENPLVVRRVKELAQSPRPGQTIVVAGARPISVPEWQGLALTWTLKPPSREEIEALVRRSLEDLRARHFPVSLDEDGIVAFVDALRGLSVVEAERLIQQAAVRDGAICAEDLKFLRSKKARLLGAAGALELIEADLGTLDSVGGLDRLKDWLRTRGRALEPAAQKFGLQPPRGVLITGVPGCGKSLVSKTLARSWNLPLVLLDVGRLYGPYVGESEGRLREALDTVEAMAPVVLWIDEIEKGFASGGAGDGGVSQRILGTFLRWMQDRPAGVFIVATSNDVSALPPELLRKGRFDEVFFVDLPGPEEREQIFSLQLSAHERVPSSFDLRALADAADGFSGAEIEASVVGALYRAYAAGGELTTTEILDELAATVPLSRTRVEDVARLRAWAASRAVPARSHSPLAHPAKAV